MSPEDVDRLIKAIDRRGASFNIQDPRVSQVQTWLIGLVGAGVVLTLGWLANSVDNLNRTAERTTVSLDNMDRRITRLEDRKP